MFQLAVAMKPSSEKSEDMPWIDIVRSATNFKDDKFTGPSFACPRTLEPFWMTDVVEEVAENKQSGSMLKRLNRPSNANLIQSYVKEELELVRKLRSKLDLPATFTKEAFFIILSSLMKDGPKDNVDMNSVAENHVKHSSEADLFTNSVTNEEQSKVFALLEENLLSLGQGVVAIILECCLTLGLWDFVQLLIEKGVVSANRSALLIDKLIYSKQAWLLCLSIKYIPDLRPQDLLQILQFFLANLQMSKGSFHLVRHHWKKAALSAIRLAAKHSRRSKNNKDTVIDLGIVQSFDTPLKKKSLRHLVEALHLAAAFDDFRPAELCLHALVASDQDDVILSSVLSHLNAREVLELLCYLNKWIAKHLKKLEPLPSLRKGNQVPTLSQASQWVSHLLDVHYTTIVLSSSFRDQLAETAEMVRALIAFDVKFSSLIGLTEHLVSKAALPEEKPGYIGADHIIEFVPIN